MKVKSVSLWVKIILVVIGFTFCVLKWFGKLPDASVSEIWLAVSAAYGVGLGTVDFNIIRDNWVESKEKVEEEEK